MKKNITFNFLYGMLIFQLLSSVVAHDLFGQGTTDQSESIIKYRKNIMKAIGGHTGALFSVVEGHLVGNQDLLVLNARAIHDAAKNLIRHFPKGSDSGRTRAKPEIWSEWEEFKNAAIKMEKVSSKLVSLSKAGKYKDFIENLRPLSQSCKGCHRRFRARR